MDKERKKKSEADERNAVCLTLGVFGFWVAWVAWVGFSVCLVLACFVALLKYIFS